MDRPVLDLDILVDGISWDMRNELAQSTRLVLVPLSKANDTFRLVKGDHCIDITGSRANSVEGDLVRRDFTINSIALPLQEAIAGSMNNWIDPLGGRYDIARKVIRTTSELRFKDDPLRILRGYRFAACLNFTIEASTLHWMRQEVETLNNIAGERIRDEIKKIFVLVRSNKWIHLMVMGNVFEEILFSSERFNELNLQFYSSVRLLDEYELLLEKCLHHRIEIIRHAARSIVQNQLYWVWKLTLLFQNIIHTDNHIKYEIITENNRHSFFFDQLVSRLRFSKREKLSGLTFLHSTPSIIEYLDRIKGKSAEVLEIFRLVSQIREEFVPVLFAGWALFNLFMNFGIGELEESIALILQMHRNHVVPFLDTVPLLTGRDIIDHFGLQPGPDIGHYLVIIREQEILGRITDRDQAINFLSQRIIKDR